LILGWLLMEKAILDK
jgi:hypothetical protein